MMCPVISLKGAKRILNLAQCILVCVVAVQCLGLFIVGVITLWAESKVRTDWASFILETRIVEAAGAFVFVDLSFSRVASIFVTT